MRCFIAVPLDNELRKNVKEIQKKFKILEGSLKFVKNENLHITVKFLGNVNKTQIERIKQNVRVALKNREPFQIEICGTGVFPSMDYVRVIWLGVENGREELIKIVKSVDEKLERLGFKREKDYVPHLTLARVKNVRVNEKEKLKKLIEELKNVRIGCMNVSTLLLYRSELLPSGPVYTELFRWEF